MKELFIEAIALLSQIEGFRTVAEDWGQLNFEQPPVNFPCALVGLGNCEFSQVGRHAQQCEGEMIVTVADMRYTTITQSTAPTEQPFNILDLLQDVNTKLHGYKSLCRVSIKKVDRPDSIREYRVIYQFSCTDTSAMEHTTTHPTPPNIDLSAKK